MKRLLTLAICLLGISLITGCDNPYISPSTSKAVSEQKQLDAELEQTEVDREIAAQLKRIADHLEKCGCSH